MKLFKGAMDIFAGATYPFNTLITSLRNRELWKYIVIPVLVNLVVAIALYGGLLFLGLELIEDVEVPLNVWTQNAIDNLPVWLHFIDSVFYLIIILLRFLLVIILFFIIGFLLTQFGVLLGAPWYGKLSEKLEELRTGKVEIVEVSIIGDINRAILYELKKIVLMAIVAIPLIFINLVPGFGNLLSTIGYFSLTATIVCLDFFDSCLERRRFSFRKKLKIVITALPASGSFAVFCMFLITIPFLNLFTIPLCVASGTLFVCDRVLPRL